MKQYYAQYIFLHKFTIFYVIKSFYTVYISYFLYSTVSSSLPNTYRSYQNLLLLITFKCSILPLKSVGVNVHKYIVMLILFRNSYFCTTIATYNLDISSSCPPLHHCTITALSSRTHHWHFTACLFLLDVLLTEQLTQLLHSRTPQLICSGENILETIHGCPVAFSHQHRIGTSQRI